MATQIVLPFLGESINEAVISRWLKKVGDPVRMGDVLAEMETDKATMDLEAPASGVVLKLMVQEGDRAQTGDLLALVGKPGEVLEEAPVQLQPAPSQPALAEPASTVTAVMHESQPETTQRRISPLARRLAREKGIDPNLLAASRPGARITSEDLEAYLQSKPQSASGRLSSHVVELNETRRVMARRMTESGQTVPQFSVSMEVEMNAFLAAINSLERKGQKTSVTALLAFVLAPALKKNPWLNARYQQDSLLIYDTVNLAVATATPQGLTVPVIHHLESLSLAEISRQLAEKAERARRGALSLDDLADSTFTVSNLGMYGVTQFVPLVNPPQAAILGVGATRPAVLPLESGGTRHIQIMTLTLTADHRVVDGAQAAEFLACLKQSLEIIQPNLV